MDTFALIAAERRRLADELDTLTEEEWQQPSLCGEWSNHQVAAHLNVPFHVSPVSFVVALAKSLGSFDKANARLAVDLASKLDPASCVEGLRANAEHRFTPPGFGPEAPLTDVIVHGVDILEPLGRSVAVAPEAFEVILPFMAAGKGSRTFAATKVDDLRFEPSDVDAHAGDGASVVKGRALPMVAVVAGRMACIEALTGAGSDLLRHRLTSRL